MVAQDYLGAAELQTPGEADILALDGPDAVVDVIVPDTCEGAAPEQGTPQAALRPGGHEAGRNTVLWAHAYSASFV